MTCKVHQMLGEEKQAPEPSVAWSFPCKGEHRKLLEGETSVSQGMAGPQVTGSVYCFGAESQSKVLKWRANSWKLSRVTPGQGLRHQGLGQTPSDKHISTKGSGRHQMTNTFQPGPHASSNPSLGTSLALGIEGIWLNSHSVFPFWPSRMALVAVIECKEQRLFFF